MVLNRKGFFLNLEDSAEQSSKPPVQVAPVKQAAAKEAPAQEAPAVQAVAAQGASATKTAAPAPTGSGPSLTTAESIAAELAAAEAARPAMTVATFAPDALMPGQPLRPQRRRPGANLKGFKAMASELFKS